MKRISALAVLGLVVSMAVSTLSATSALAGGPVFNVKINSFTRIGDTNSTLGELCGTVTVTSAQMAASGNLLIPVTVTSDPNTSNPGSYTILADRAGNFCVVVNTYTGTASAEAWLPGTQAESPVAPISPAKQR